MQATVNEYYAINSRAPQGGTLNISALGGPIEVRWDPDAKVTQWGGMVYFATFLKMSEMFDRLVADAPFKYASNNAPEARDVVGTMVLAIIAGLTRYCHIDRLRNDAASAGLLGLTKIVSDESVRRALKNATRRSWMHGFHGTSVK